MDSLIIKFLMRKNGCFRQWQNAGVTITRKSVIAKSVIAETGWIPIFPIVRNGLEVLFEIEQQTGPEIAVLRMAQRLQCSEWHGHCNGKWARSLQCSNWNGHCSSQNWHNLCNCNNHARVWIPNILH